MTGRTLLRLETLAVGLPGAVVAAGAVIVMMLRFAGLPPFEPSARMTLSEAAALESDADVVRLLRAGADPSAPTHVRRTRIRAVGAALTPLEAAMSSRHVSVMTLLADGGARLGPDEVPRLWCLATGLRNADAQAWLRARAPEAARTSCADVPRPGWVP